MSIRIHIPTANVITANHRDHFRKKAEKTRHLRTIGRLAAADDKSKYGCAHLTVTIGWPDKRRRDAHNIFPTIKALIDGMVDAGLLPDDDDKHLIGPDLRIASTGSRGVIELNFDFKEIS
jgi:crossover junction endodeoxyribonuclease RusA